MATRRGLRVLLLLVPGLALGLAFLGGWMFATAPVRKRVRKKAATHTLGGALAPEERAGAASAFLDPAAALRDMDGYSYAVPTTPAPFLGAIPAPGRQANAQIDRFGLRGPHPLALAKPPGRLRVFLLGGSTAYGSGAPDQARTPAGYLQAALSAALPGREVEVFACATPAWTSHHERIAIEQRVRGWSPDLVVALSGANDAQWGFGGRDPAWSRTYEDEHFFRIAEAALERAGAGPLSDVVETAPDPLPPAGLAAGLLRNARLAAAALEGVPYLLCLQPALPCTHKPLSAREQALRERWPEAQRAHYQAVWAAYREAFAMAAPPGGQVALHDLDPALAARPAQEELFLDAVHFGDRGNALLAQRMAELALPLLR